MIPKWMKELSREKDAEEFSQLVHNYYKLATMRVMQEIREKYNVPKEDQSTLTIAIFARMLNEAVYSVGANIKENYPIENFYTKEQLLNLLKVLNGEPLDQFERGDIEIDLQHGINKFREFIMSKAHDFYVDSLTS